MPPPRARMYSVSCCSSCFEQATRTVVLANRIAMAFIMNPPVSSNGYIMYPDRNTRLGDSVAGSDSAAFIDILTTEVDRDASRIHHSARGVAQTERVPQLVQGDGIDIVAIRIDPDDLSSWFGVAAPTSRHLGAHEDPLGVWIVDDGYAPRC